MAVGVDSNGNQSDSGFHALRLWYSQLDELLRKNFWPGPVDLRKVLSFICLIDQSCRSFYLKIDRLKKLLNAKYSCKSFRKPPSFLHGTLVSLLRNRRYPQDVVALLTALKLDFTPHGRGQKGKEARLTIFFTLLKFSQIYLP